MSDDQKSPPDRARVRRSAAFLRHTIEHDGGVEDTSAAAQSAVGDVLFGAEQWVDSPDPDAGTVFGIPTSKVRHQFEMAQSVTGEADPNLAMLAALRLARDWVPPLHEQGSAVLAPAAVAALDGLCGELEMPGVREGVDAVELFERAAGMVRTAKVADRVSTQVRQVRQRGGGTRQSPVLRPRDEVLAARRLALAMGDDPESTPHAVMAAAAEWFEVNGPKLRAQHRDRVERVSGEPGRGPADDESAARAFKAVRSELGCAKDAGPTAVLRRAAEVRDYARSFEEVARTVSEGSFYRSLVVSKVDEAWSQCRALVPMIAEHCSEEEAGGIGGDGPSVEVLERTLRGLIERAARWSGAAEVIADLGATRAVLDPDGDNVEMPVAQLARGVLDDRRDEAARGGRLKSDRDALFTAAARLVGTGITPETGLAEVVDLVEQLRPMVAPSSPSAVGVLYAARNRLSVLEGAASQAEMTQVAGTRQAALRSIGEALHVTDADVDAAQADGEHAGLDRDVVWHRVLADRAVEAYTVWASAGREGDPTGSPYSTRLRRDVARIVGLDDPQATTSDVLAAVRAVAVRAKARTTVVATALLPGPGSRESRAVSQHVLHVEPGCPDANVDLTIPWGVLDGRFGPTGGAWARVADYVRERNAGPITDVVVESLLRAAVDTERAARAALVEWVTDEVDPDGAWEMTPKRLGEAVTRLVTTVRDGERKRVEAVRRARGARVRTTQSDMPLPDHADILTIVNAVLYGKRTEITETGN